VKDGLDEPDGSSVTVQLRLLATTDLHVHLLPWDYYADRPLPATGLAQAARLIRALRDEAPGACLLLDNGDVLQGSLLSDFIAAERRALGRGTIHPMIAAMNALGYDAGTLGNHEFDHGLPYLRSILAEAAFPLVSTNLRPGDGLPLAEPWVVLAREVPGPDGRSQTGSGSWASARPRPGAGTPCPKRARWMRATSSTPRARRSRACAPRAPTSSWRSAIRASAATRPSRRWRTPPFPSRPCRASTP
jgi:hypothetical protein